jgi:hypothetical protein
MELLSSVHWVASHDPNPATNAEMAIRKIAAWNERKARMFKAEHIKSAWRHLVSQNWIAA